MPNLTARHPTPIRPNGRLSAGDLNWLFRMFRGARTSTGLRCWFKSEGMIIPSNATEGIGFNFFEHGKIFWAGETDITPEWTDEQKVNANTWVIIDLFDNGALTVETDDAADDKFPAVADWDAGCEYYAIRRAGVQVQNSDLHIPFVPFTCEI